MIKRKLISLVVFIILFLLFTCIDPYAPQLSGYESVLVVEGLITDQKEPSEVRLSRSIQSRDSVPEKITDAIVSISDEAGIITILNNCGSGIYRTDTSSFSGETGKTYTLHISMSDGNEYISDPSVMYAGPGIDTVYFEKDEEVGVNQTEILEGIRILVDTENPGDESYYFRWEVEEVWKYRLPTPIRFDYISESLVVEIDTVKEFCWRSNTPDEIHIGFSLSFEPVRVKEPLIFIASSASDRLTLRYSLLVKQFSISRKEYDFWDNLKKVNETGGDIFDTQPYAVMSNITNIADPEEKVLGYFKVSSVKEKRIYLTPAVLADFDLQPYKYNCREIAKTPKDYPPPSPFVPPLTWDGLVEMFESDPRYVFVEPIYQPTSTELMKLVFAKVECAVCEVAGTSKKPDFWID